MIPLAAAAPPCRLGTQSYPQALVLLYPATNSAIATPPTLQARSITCNTYCVAACSQAALGLGGSNNGAATAGAAGTIPVGDPTAADTTWGAAKKRMAVAADNQDATNITSYAKPDFVKQLIRKSTD